MIVERMADRWLKAGLIRPDLALRLVAYERIRRARRIKLAMAALGAPVLILGFLWMVSDVRNFFPPWLTTALDILALAGLGIGAFFAMLIKFRPEPKRLLVAALCLTGALAALFHMGTLWKYFPLEAIVPGGVATAAAFMLARGNVLSMLTLCALYLSLGLCLKIPQIVQQLGLSNDFDLHPWIACLVPGLWAACQTIRGLWLMGRAVITALRELVPSRWFKDLVRLYRWLGRLHARLVANAGAVRAYAMEIFLGMLSLCAVIQKFPLLSDLYQHTATLMLVCLLGLVVIMISLLRQEKPLFSALFSAAAWIEILMLALRVQDQGLAVSLSTSHYGPGRIVYGIGGLGLLALAGRALTQSRIPVAQLFPLGPMGLLSLVLLAALS